MPLPVPVKAVVIVIAPGLLFDADHGQPPCVVTETEPLPPLAGTVAEVATKGQRVHIPSETRLTFTLQDPVRL